LNEVDFPLTAETPPTITPNTEALSAYTAPALNEVDFELTTHTAPSLTPIDFEVLDAEAGFPTQYAGLRTFYGAVVKELCLVAIADAPTGMGGVIKIDKNGTLYAAYLVETNDANASNVRVKTATGTKAVRLKT
jgi:hypothetical protein